jgi:hypothetical protein
MRDADRRPASAVRDTVLVLVSLLVLGGLCGVLWWAVVDPAEFTKTARGGAMGENDLGKRFDADAWFVLIGGPAGLLAGLVLTAWRTRDALLTSALLVVGSALAAAAMAVVGHLLGPSGTELALKAAHIGGRVPEPLSVDTFIVYLAWPVGVLAGSLFVLLGRAPEPERWAAQREAAGPRTPPPSTPPG